MKIKTIEQSVIIKASPHEVYETLMDSKKHAQLIGDKANISREIGGEFTAYIDYIEGINLELIPDKKIVQKWRANEWPEGHHSEATLLLDETKDGTQLKFRQSGIPEKFVDDIAQGWWDYYWNPMKQILEKD